MPVRFIKSGNRGRPRVSFVLLDWSVRESFHILHYLGQQDCAREDFEVLIIEYYDREYQGIRRHEDQVDTWVTLQMPPDLYYHKHMMYNVGIALARGDIVSICDSDAMVKPGHVRRIVRHFEQHPRSVLHMDQFRNNRRELYPFSFPSFEEVQGPGCINNAGGVTTGVADDSDPIHSRNYGACMCARRADLIAIGGADEHVDYVGHICGPYDMTFRLVNAGLEEIWARDEFTYHTWHPGQAGVDNYLGPHDGRHMSTTSLLSLVSRRILPLVENAAVRMLRNGETLPQHGLDALLVDRQRAGEWRHSELDGAGSRPATSGAPHLVGSYHGARILHGAAGYSAHWIGDRPEVDALNGNTFPSQRELRIAVDRALGPRLRFWLGSYRMFCSLLHLARPLVRILRRPARLRESVRDLASATRRVIRDQHSSQSGMQDLLVYLGAGPGELNAGLRIAVLDHIDGLLLRLFAVLRVVPAAEPVRVAGLEDAARALSETRAAGTRLLVPAGMFIRFYSVFARAAAADLQII